MESNARHTWNGLAKWVASTPFLREGSSARPRETPLVNQHRVPTMPIMIDGSETDSRAVYDFMGRALITIVDGDALTGKMLHIFSNQGEAAAYVEAAEAPLSRRGRATGTFR